MKRKLFKFVTIFIILTIILIILTGCDSKNSKSNVGNSDDSLNVDLDEIQNNFETIISSIQIEFIKKENENPEADISKYITYEKLDNAMKEYDYKICLENDINGKPTDMSELVTDKNEIYFAHENNIFKVKVSKTDEKFDVITGSVELVK